MRLFDVWIWNGWPQLVDWKRAMQIARSEGSVPLWLSLYLPALIGGVAALVAGMVLTIVFD